MSAATLSRKLLRVDGRPPRIQVDAPGIEAAHASDAGCADESVAELAFVPLFDEYLQRAMPAR
jgi:hypothetical protein